MNEAPTWFFLPVFYGLFLAPVLVPTAALVYVSKRYHWNKFWLGGAGIWLVCTGGAVTFMLSGTR